MSEYTYPYPRPAVTVDIVLHGVGFAYTKPGILLIKRLREPFKNMWALPGGFRDPGEQLLHAALRELKEETGVTGVRLSQLHTFGNPGRDPRGDTVSVAYYGYYTRLKALPRSWSDKDEVKEIAWHDVDNLPPLAFDHRDIIQYALANT